MKQLRFFASLLYMICALVGFAERPAPVVEHIGLENGLSNNFVSDITQDKHGYLWIGTESGLNRFDGENFKVYNEHCSPLKGNSINALYYNADSDKLLIGSKKGLNILDCTTQRFETITLPDGITDLNIVGFANAADGGIYILNNYNHILHYNPKTRAITKLDLTPYKGMHLSFKSIATDSQGDLYIGHGNYGFTILNLKDKRFRNFRNTPGDDKSLPGNNIKTIHIDRYQNIWLGTDHGLALFNPVSNDFTRFSNGESGHNSIPSHNIYTIKEFNDGLLWIGSDLGGVCMLDIRNLAFSNPGRLQFATLPTTGDRNGISSDRVHTLFQDSFGNIWIGNFGDGLDFISHIQPKFDILPYFTLQNNLRKIKPIWSLYADKQGNVWAGSEDEVACINEGKVQRTYNLSNQLNHSRGYISSIIRIGDSLLVSSFEDGIYKMDISSGSLQRLETPGYRNYANNFTLMPTGDVLIGMQDGLYKYAGGSISKITDISATINNLIPNGITTDAKGNLWLGTYGNGIFIFDKNHKLLKHLDHKLGLSSNAIKQLYRDSRGWIWIAGQDGLSVIKDTSKPDAIVNFGYDSGLYDIHFHAIQEDSDGNMWFSTNNGLVKWNKNSSNLENYDYHDGLPLSSFIDLAACASPDGNLYFGSLKGTCTFNPARFRDDNQIPIFDAEKAGGIKVNDPAFRAKYFQNGGVNDTAHLNEAGHNLITKKALEFLISR